MGLPDVVIEFQKTAVTAISVGTGGVVGIILKGTADAGAAYTIKNVEDVSDTLAELSEENVAYVNRAWTGNPTKVIVYVLPASATDYSEALRYFGTVRVNYICGDPEITSAQATALATWTISKRKAGKLHPVAVVPETASDDEGVVNFCIVTEGDDEAVITVGDETFTAAQYCSRIAGLLAGLSLTQSATYKPLAEVTAIPLVDDDTVDEAIDAGKLVLYDTGSGIVIARGINSLVTTTSEKTEDLKKIKIVAIQDRITEDIMDTINESYIGNYSNSYDNKCLLVTAILAYLQTLEDEGYLESGHSTMDINVEKQRKYLESVGTDTTDMEEQDIREANTGSHVFLSGTVSVLDAIEDIDIVIVKE